MADTKKKTLGHTEKTNKRLLKLRILVTGYSVFIGINFIMYTSTKTDTFIQIKKN